MSNYQVNDEGYYGEFGGTYIPDKLKACVSELRENYKKVLDTPEFKEEFK